MKKTLLAAALAVGFAGAAHAQTSVTLYGVVDEGFGYEQYKTKFLDGTSEKETRTGLFASHQNGTRFGLRGSEDLGGGLKAIFTLEGGVNQNEGISAQGGRLFGRQAFMGLASDSWGTLTAGRQYNIALAFSTPTIISPHGDIYGLNSIHRSFASGTGAVRVDNLVKYVSPEFSGFQFGLGYSFEFSGSQPGKTKGQDDEDQTYLTLGLKYSNGPLTLVAAYDQLNKRDDIADDKDVKSWLLGASYDFDVATLHLGYGQDNDGITFDKAGSINGLLGAPGFVDDSYKTNNYSVGFTIPVDASSKFMVNWQSSRLGSGAFKDANRADGGKSSQNIYTVAYRYDLSKRTNVYVTAGVGNGYSFNDTKATEMVVGLRHAF